MTNNFKILFNHLPITEYIKIKDIYEFIYNVYVFIYQIDPILLNDTNFICNYLIHKHINNEIMYNKLCFGLTDIKYVNNLKVYYINIAGVNLLLENIILEKKINEEIKYNIIQIYNNECTLHSSLNNKNELNIHEENINNYFKIIFYIEILNKNNISKEILTNLKYKLNKQLQILSNKDII